MNLISNFLLVLFLYVSTAESAEILHYVCSDNSKTNVGSEISKNIDTLLPLLVLGSVNDGYIDTNYGEGKDQIYGLTRCRGDLSRDDCSSCVIDAAKQIRNVCPNKADARIWYEYCFLRFSTEKFFDQVDTSGSYMVSHLYAPYPDVFKQKLAALMDQITSEAVKPESKGLGKGKSDVSSSTRLYAMAQCTRDLSESHCAQCLSTATSNFPAICGSKRGCRLLYSSCYVRYEIYPFFFPLDP